MKLRTLSALLSFLLCVMLLTGCVLGSDSADNSDEISRLDSIQSSSDISSANQSTSAEKNLPTSPSATDIPIATTAPITTEIPLTTTAVTTEAPLTTTAITTQAPLTATAITTQAPLPTTPALITTAPVATTAPTATTAPLTTAPVTVAPIEADFEIVSLPAPTKRGNQATMTVKGEPGATYTLEIKYKSGWSVANGLGAKPADADGYVTWTWKVGSRTTLGVWEIKITDGESNVLYNAAAFTVIE